MAGRAILHRTISGCLALLAAALFALSCATTPPPRFPDVQPGDPSFLATVSAHTDAQFVGGNRVEILLNGDGTFPPLLRAIANARRSITFEQYFYDRGPISNDVANALAERCAHGVKVHVLLDSVGANGMSRNLIAHMKESGCEVEWFRRIKLIQFVTPWELLAYNNRTHRRIAVIDGALGFTGGYGISRAWMGDGLEPGHWRDTNVAIEGPAVAQLQAAFVQDWRETTGTVLGGDDYFPALARRGDVTAEIVASSPGEGANASYMLYLLAIATASESIYITNPYFVLDDEMREALIDAAARGVSVVVLVPGKIENELVRVDQNLVHYAGRGGFGPLLRAGVRIFEFKPCLLHAKTMVIDGQWAIVGSTNFDRRSFALNKEINLTAFDPAVSRKLTQIFWDDVGNSDEITYEKWRSRGLYERILGWFALPAKSQL